MSRTRIVAVVVAGLATAGSIAPPLVAAATPSRVDVPARTWLCLKNKELNVGGCLNDPLSFLSR